MCLVYCKLTDVLLDSPTVVSPLTTLASVQDDPLNETLDKLFSVQLRDSVTEVPVNVPQGVKDICAELEREEGIDSVVLGRQAEEKRVVSQVHQHSRKAIHCSFACILTPDAWRHQLLACVHACMHVLCEP